MLLMYAGIKGMPADLNEAGRIIEASLSGHTVGDASPKTASSRDLVGASDGASK